MGWEGGYNDVVFGDGNTGVEICQRRRLDAWGYWTGAGVLVADGLMEERCACVGFYLSSVSYYYSRGEIMLRDHAARG